MTHWTDTFSPRRFTARPGSHLRGRPGRLEHRRARGLAGIVVRVIDRLFLWQDRANGRHQLARLDDRLLKDIGISRVDAHYEACKPFWRP